MAYDYALLKVERRNRIAFVTIENPPLNIITLPLFQELIELSQELESDRDLMVVVLKSADPDFFIAHFDVQALLDMPVEGEARRESETNAFHAMCERFRNMDKITIAQIEGRVGGGGNELVSAFDMRFGVAGKTRINQMEVAVGILPGGGGTQRLPRIIGRARAMEVILGCEDLDAETAERWGHLNRIFSAAEIGPFVERLAQRIASYPEDAVKLAKESINSSSKPLRDGLLDEAFLFQRLMRTDAAHASMQRFLELGGQTREGELMVDEICDTLSEEAKMRKNDEGKKSGGEDA